MEIWLLKSKKGSQTCGHVHVAEVEAWRCLDTQAEPSAWAVVSACLTVKDKRLRRDMEYVLLLGAWVVLVPLLAALSAALVVQDLIRQSWETAFLFAVGLAFCVPASFHVVAYFRKEIGRSGILGWMVRWRMPRQGR